MLTILVVLISGLVVAFCFRCIFKEASTLIVYLVIGAFFTAAITEPVYAIGWVAAYAIGWIMHYFLPGPNAMT